MSASRVAHRVSEPAAIPSRCPATWALVAFWVAWCLGPGVVVWLVLGPSVVNMTPSRARTEERFMLAVFATSALVSLALGFVRNGPRRRLEYWLLLLFWVVMAAGFVWNPPFKSEGVLIDIWLTIGVLVPCVATARLLRDATVQAQQR